MRKLNVVPARFTAEVCARAGRARIMAEIEKSFSNVEKAITLAIKMGCTNTFCFVHKSALAQVTKYLDELGYKSIVWSIDDTDISSSPTINLRISWN